MEKLKVLITGPFGRLGPSLLPSLRERFDLRTFDRAPDPDDPNNPRHIIGELTDFEALQRACGGIEVVVHLAATSDEAPFHEQLVPGNVTGMFNVLEAARQCGVRRVVFASSAQTVNAYQGNQQVRVSDPVRPHSMYGATKVFGEALGRQFHEKHGLEFVAIRIGWFMPYVEGTNLPERPSMIWLSPRDCAQLFLKAVETPDVGYAIVFGTSKPPFEHLSLQEARDVLGYEPQDETHPLDEEGRVTIRVRRRRRNPEPPSGAA